MHTLARASHYEKKNVLFILLEELQVLFVISLYEYVPETTLLTCTIVAYHIFHYTVT